MWKNETITLYKSARVECGLSWTKYHLLFKPLDEFILLFPHVVVAVAAVDFVRNRSFRRFIFAHFNLSLFHIVAVGCGVGGGCCCYFLFLSSIVVSHWCLLLTISIIARLVIEFYLLLPSQILCLFFHLPNVMPFSAHHHIRIVIAAIAKTIANFIV